MRQFFLGLVAALAAQLMFVVPAFADAIDGKWCNGARQFSIDGPTIILPSGRPHQGDYDRHGFRYVVPESEEDAGADVRMALQSDELLHLERTPKGASETLGVEQWRRCVNIS